MLEARHNTPRLPYPARSTQEIFEDYHNSGLTSAEYLFYDTPELRAQRKAERNAKDINLANEDMRTHGKNKRRNSGSTGES